MHLLRATTLSTSSIARRVSTPYACLERQRDWRVALVLLLQRSSSRFAGGRLPMMVRATGNPWPVVGVAKGTRWLGVGRLGTMQTAAIPAACEVKEPLHRRSSIFFKQAMFQMWLVD
ncbi:hypothetical protein IF2G_08361 [Cordyceps javanica]|nr:hypothetical protein IF2G_08361 [Cordyceps javanica]